MTKAMIIKNEISFGESVKWFFERAIEELQPERAPALVWSMNFSHAKIFDDRAEADALVVSNPRFEGARVVPVVS